MLELTPGSVLAPGSTQSIIWCQAVKPGPSARRAASPALINLIFQKSWGGLGTRNVAQVAEHRAASCPVGEALPGPQMT